MICKNRNGVMLVNIFFKIFLQFFKIRVECPFKQLYHLTTVAEEKCLKLIFSNFITVAAYKQYGIKNKLKFLNKYAHLDIGLA